MVLQQIQHERAEGILNTPAAAASIIAPLTPVVLYTLPNVGFGAGVGVTAKLVKVVVANRSAVKGTLQIGIGTILAFTQVIPDLDIFPNLTAIFGPEDLPDYWFNLWTALTAGNIIAQTTLAGAAAPTNVLVLPTFLEKGV